jgi:glucose uptake protein
VVLPNSFNSALVLLILSAACWGSWSNTQKLAGGRWRFELFYLDFAFGAALCAVIGAFTCGSLNAQELTFQDNLLITGYRNMVYAAAAGIVFNLGNMLMTGAMAVSGMSIAFPVALGLALVSQTVGAYILSPLASPAPLFSGIALVLAGVMLAGMAYTAQIEARRIAANREAEANPDAPPRRRLPRARRGIVLASIGGVLIGLSYLLLTRGAWVEPPLSPYGTGVFLAAGVWISTFIYSPFFMNFPIQGRTVEFSAYFKGGKREHLLGMLGGAIWMAGAILTFITATSTVSGPIGSSTTFVLLQSAGFIGTAWGLLAWHEFKGAPARPKLLMAGMYLCLTAGIAGIVFGQLNPQ